MKWILPILLVFTLLLACKDAKDVYVYEKNEVKSKVILRDTLAELKDKPAKAVIFLAENSTADTYLYKLEADEKGEFTLPYLPNKGRLCLVGKFTDSNGIEFHGYLERAEFFSKDLILRPVYPGGKLKVIFFQGQNNVIDTTKRISGADVYLFTSKTQAQSVLTLGSESGFVAKKATNEQGVVFFYNLDAYKYYLVAKTTNSKGKVVFAEEEIEITSTTQSSRAVYVRTFPRGVNSFTVRVVDPDLADARVQGVSVYLFKDKTHLESVAYTNGPTGYSLEAQTDASGECVFEASPDNKYYLGLVFRRSDGDRLYTNYNDALNVVSDTVIVKKLQVARFNKPFTVLVKGKVSKEPISNARVYLFSSQIQAQSLFNKAGPVDSVAVLPTNAKGEAIFSDLFKGEFYLGVKTSGNGSRVLSDKINIEAIREKELFIDNF